MNVKNKSLAINSILIVISTTIIGTILHELSHFFMANYYGLNPELHHNSVNYLSRNVTEIQKATIAGIGPTFSLISGVLFLIISIKIVKASLFKLFLLWQGMNGILMFLGYIFIAPITKNGDTGKVLDYFSVPTSVSIIFAAFSLIVIIRLFKSLSKEFRYYKNQEVFEQNENSKQLFLFPILSSIIFITLLSLPVVTWISLLPTLFMPMAYFSIMRSYRKLDLNNAELKITRISKTLISITILLIITFKILI